MILSSTKILPLETIEKGAAIKMSAQQWLVAFSLIIRLIAIGSADLIAEEAYYWNYANHLDFGYLDHPPMVALLIKLSTFVFGINEFGVRFCSIICWSVCVGFSYALTQRISPKSGQKTVFLLSVLPFFFLHSLIITPDLPLIAAWSACLYYLYLALIEEKKSAWYWVGLWLGLGMLSKYTIILLGPATLVYLIITRKAHRTLLSPYPYVAILIAIILFSPVIYWNATHEWASFLFQSTRRFSAMDEGSIFAFLGLLTLFITPLGLVGLGQLLLRPTPKRFSYHSTSSISLPQRRFMQCFTLVPLLFFAGFSLTHMIKFNWIGPSLLAFIPWLAAIDVARLQRAWLLTGLGLLLGYIVLLFSIICGHPAFVYHSFLSKYIDWNSFSQQVHQIAEQTEQKWKQPVTLLPIDRYNIASELAFYQMRASQHKPEQVVYPVTGSDLFGYESLMYHYWSNKTELTHHIVVLIAENPSLFGRPNIQEKIVALSPVQQFWTHSQGSKERVNPYYYELVRLK